MLWLYAKYCTSVGASKFLYPGKDMKVKVKHDQHFHKVENHYEAWRNAFAPLLPTYENKIPERYGWRHRQPAYLSDAVEMSAFTGLPEFISDSRKLVQWVTIR